jgi:hypothetical protein
MLKHFLKGGFWVRCAAQLFPDFYFLGFILIRTFIEGKKCQELSRKDGLSDFAYFISASPLTRLNPKG